MVPAPGSAPPHPDRRPADRDSAHERPTAAADQSSIADRDCRVLAGCVAVPRGSVTVLGSLQRRELRAAILLDRLGPALPRRLAAAHPARRLLADLPASHAPRPRLSEADLLARATVFRG